MTIKANFIAEEYMTKDHRLVLNQSLIYSIPTNERYGSDYEFIGVTDIHKKGLNHH